MMAQTYLISIFSPTEDIQKQCTTKIHIKDIILGEEISGNWMLPRYYSNVIKQEVLEVKIGVNHVASLAVGRFGPYTKNRKWGPHIKVGSAFFVNFFIVKIVTHKRTVQEMPRSIKYRYEKSLT